MSWKEIAASLGVSVKTAQLWERYRGLPVRRLPGSRGRVYADQAELETWRRSATAITLPPAPAPAEVGQNFRNQSLAGLGVLFLLVLGVFLFIPARVPVLDAGVPVTSTPGLEFGPDLSPDGERVAFVSGEPGRDGLSLFTIPVMGGVRTLVARGVLQGFARWSPDGHQLAFARAAASGADVVLRDLQSGTERLVANLAGAEHQQNHLDSLLFSWTPDGRNLLVSDGSAGAPLAIFSVPLSGGERRPVTSPPANIPGDTQPIVSPDGTRVAFVRQQTFSEADVFVQPLAGGAPLRVTTDMAKVDGLAWHGNDRLVYSSNRLLGRTRLWMVEAGGGSPIRLSGDEGNANYPSVRHTRTGDYVVYQFQVWDTNLWTQLLTQDATPTQLVPSTWVDYNPVPSPVDDRLAFVSKRSGATEIWISDHGQEKQLTHLAGPYVDSPRWSPTADALVFTAQERGNRDIYLIPGNGGSLRRLTSDISEEGRASFSRDGRWVYFRSNRTGKPQIWKMPLDGGPAVQVTKGGGYEAFENPNGTLVYYVRERAKPGLWMVSTGGGAEVPILPDVSESQWSVADDGIYYLVKSTVYKYEYATHQRRTAGVLRTTKPFHTGFSVTHTGTRAYWTQIDEDSADVMRARLR